MSYVCNGLFSPVYTGILIQIGCVYMEANWIQIQTQTTSDSDPEFVTWYSCKRGLLALWDPRKASVLN